MTTLDFGYDAIYEHTRSRGKPGTVTVAGETSTGVDGVKTRNDTTHNIRWLVQQKTEYSAIIAAESVKQRVGDVTFVIWLQDVKSQFTQLKTKDWIEQFGQRFDVVSSREQDNALVITAFKLQEAP